MDDSRAPDDDEVSRRAFLGTTGGAILTPEMSVSQSVERNAFQPGTKPEKLSDNLYFLADTCNVYLLRRGNRGLLIDFGSGKILDFLPDLGVAGIDWIFHTHFHRDQAQGDLKAVAHKIPIAVPEHERQFFEAAENFWRNRRAFEQYEVRNDFFSLTQNVPVSFLLRDYGTFDWNGLPIFIQPSPGHTLGSISLVTELDGQRVAFSGDLMHSPGKVVTLYDLQYYYGEHEGPDLSIYSLNELARLKPQLLCPSHGEPLRAPLAGMQGLITKLTAWHHYWYKHLPTSDLQPVSISPHLVANTESTSTFYAVISDSGRALFLDYGAASWTFFQVFTRYVDTFGSMRFVEHTIQNLRAHHGLKSIDVAMPSHMHDDHLNGFPYLAGRYETKIWCYENMVDVLQNPRTLNVGCIYGQPIKVDRTFRNRESFKWEEFEFTVVHSPGHTNYQMAMFATIDGTRVAFTGDAFFDNPEEPHTMRHNLIYRNQVKSGDHVQSIRNILDFEPQMIAPGHGKPFPVDHGKALNFEKRARQQDAFFRDLVANAEPDFGIDPSWVSIYPYQMQVLHGSAQTAEVRVRNYGAQALHLEGMLIAPSGWSTSPNLIALDVPPHSNGSATFTISIPKRWTSELSRVAVALDVMSNGKYLGQIAEAVVDVRPA